MDRGYSRQVDVEGIRQTVVRKPGIPGERSQYSEFVRTSHFCFPCMGKFMVCYCHRMQYKTINFTNHKFPSCKPAQNMEVFLYLLKMIPQ